MKLLLKISTRKETYVIFYDICSDIVENKELIRVETIEEQTKNPRKEWWIRSLSNVWSHFMHTTYIMFTTYNNLDCMKTMRVDWFTQNFRMVEHPELSRNLVHQKHALHLRRVMIYLFSDNLGLGKCIHAPHSYKYNLQARWTGHINNECHTRYILRCGHSYMATSSKSRRTLQNLTIFVYLNVINDDEHRTE